MKCVYCNEERDLTVSDIIPYALTGAKLRKTFVCKKHNAFTNDNYEKEWIGKLAFFRNLIGFTTRSGDEVSYKADIEVDGYKLANIDLTNRASFFADKKRLFPSKSDSGGKVLIGNVDKLSQKRGVDLRAIKPVNIQDAKANVHFSLNELFASEYALHVVAKIAYESYCYYNKIESFDASKYAEIVSYILNPDDSNNLVEIVVDLSLYGILNLMSRTGSNMLFEYDDVDGFKYIIFNFWNLVIYKIKICKNDNKQSSLGKAINIYLFHLDGEYVESKFVICGTSEMLSDSPNKALSIIYKEIVGRIESLGNCEFSYKYLYSLVKKIEPLIHNCEFELLLDYGDFKKVAGIFILEQIYLNREKYDFMKSFNENVLQILGNKEVIKFSAQDLEQIITRYKVQEDCGKFRDVLKKALEFFKEIKGD